MTSQPDAAASTRFVRLAHLEHHSEQHALAGFGESPGDRENVRARMPQPEETEALDLPTSGGPVVGIVRTACVKSA